jgi:Xaa-Pro aminopeptidase
VLKAGMIVSNEPGYYEDGNFGIRIENLLEIQRYEEPNADMDKPKGVQKKFLKFAKLTMIPIQQNLIDVKLMSPDELDWIDNYHADVLDKVGCRLEEGSSALAWLRQACAKIDRSHR